MKSIKQTPLSINALFATKMAIVLLFLLPMHATKAQNLTLVKDINTPQITDLKNTVVYAVGNKIYYSDGTSSGTRIAYTGAAGADISDGNLTLINRGYSTATQLFFEKTATSTKVLRYNFATVTTIATINGSNNFRVLFNNFGTAAYVVNGNELWSIKNNVAPKLVKTFNAPIVNFVGNYVTTANSIWYFDIDLQTVTLLKDGFTEIGEFSNGLFAANGGGFNGIELWTMNGILTPYFLHDINPNSASSNPRHFKDNYFTATSNGQDAIYSTSNFILKRLVVAPTNTELKSVFSFNPGYEDGNYYSTIAYTAKTGSELLLKAFRADSPTITRQIARFTEGSIAYNRNYRNVFMHTKNNGTRDIWTFDFANNTASILIPNASIDNIVAGYVYGDDGKLWRINLNVVIPTATMIKDFGGGSKLKYHGQMTPYSSVESRYITIFTQTINSSTNTFSIVFDNTNRELISDVSTVNYPPKEYSSFPANFQEINGKILFTATDGERGEELWRTDGTTAGTTLFKELNEGPFGNVGKSLKDNGFIYYQTSKPESNSSIYWKTDGTTIDSVRSTTTEFQTVNNRFKQGQNYPSLTVGNVKYQTYYNTYSLCNRCPSAYIGGFQRILGTDTSFVFSFNYVSCGASAINSLQPLGNKIFFTFHDELTSSNCNKRGALWVSDGTAAGTKIVKTFTERPSDIVVANNKLYFTAKDGVNGLALFSSDGTAAGTRVVTNFVTSPALDADIVIQNPNAPSGSYLTNGAIAYSFSDQYIRRARGYIKPSESGNYRFYIAGDDNVDVYLSTDDNPANKRRIAYLQGFTGSFEFTKYASQTSNLVNLTAGRRYYVEIVNAEKFGDDLFNLNWTTPSVSARSAIPVEQIESFCGEPVVVNLPDLVIENLNINTPSVSAGQEVGFTMTPRNIGNAIAAGHIPIKGYLSTDRILDASDLATNSSATNDLGIGQSNPSTGGGLLTTGLAAGNYYIILKIDPDNIINESNENNNVLISTSTITIVPLQQLPDLIARNLNITTPSVQQGQSATIRVDISNIGLAAAGSFKVTAYISADNVFSTNDIESGNFTTANYGAGVTFAQVAGSALVPANLPVGQYFIILKIDSDNQIIESNEDNNIHVSPTVFNVTAATQVGNYCASKGVAPWEYAISNVTLNTLNNNSDKFKDINALGYSDYTSLTTTLTKGETYPLSITPLLSWIGNLPNAYCRVWIDFNQNKTFEANELVLKKTNTNPLTTNILIPTTAFIGATRMRVSLKNGSYSTACETFEKGEVEDYTVTIAEPEMLIDNTILQITSASVLPNTFKPGDRVAVTFTIKNKDTVPNSPNKTLKLSRGTSRSGKRSVSFTFNGFSNNVPIGVILLPNETRTLTRNFIINSDYSPIQPYPTPFEAYERELGNYLGLSSANFLSSFSLLDTFPASLPPVNVILPYGDLEVTMSTTTPIYTNKKINYTVKIKNKSAETIPDVEARVFNLGYFTFDSTVLTPSKGTTVAYNAVGELYTVVGYWRAGSLAPNEEATCVVQIFSGFWGFANITPTITADVHSIRRYDTIIANNSASLSFRLDTATSSTTNDIALSLSSTPSVYRQYSKQNFVISAKNTGNQAFTNVKIKFPRPANTVNGGTKIASIGTFQDYCPNNIECSEWTIPTLAGGTTATLDVPVYVLNPTGAMTATATLLSSTPVDNIVANNTATVTINASNTPLVQPLIQSKPTQLVPVIIQKIAPTLTENYIVVELESIVEKTIDFQILNALGNVVLTEKIKIDKGNNKFDVNVSQLPKGMYFIQTSVGKGRNVPMKFVKM